jgi:hypothetical protein
MKHRYLTPLLLASCVFASPALSFADSAQPAIRQSLIDVDSFRDFSVSGMSPERSAEVWNAEFARFADHNAALIPQGLILHLEFTDIDMAGDIQPWRNRNNADIRYVENIYPPRLVFRYSLVNAEGAVVASGEATLRNLAFLFGARPIRQYDTFHYELEMLRDWLRRDLRDVATVARS